MRARCRLGSVVVLGVLLTLACRPLFARGASFDVTPDKAVALLFEAKKLEPPKRTGVLSGPPGRVWSMPVNHPGETSAIRIHVVVKSAQASKAWRLKVLDGGKVVEEIESLSPLIASGDFWTTEIPNQGAMLEIWSDGDPSGIQLEIDAYAFRVSPAVPQATHGNDDKIPIDNAPDDVKKLAAPIARLTIMNDRGGIYCTGFLVTESLLMTNEHCVTNEKEAQSTLAQFGYDSASAPRSDYRGIRLEAVDHNLDYALVRMSPAPGVVWSRVTLDPGRRLADIAKLVVIQHPSGLPKMAVVDDCAVDGQQRVGRGGTQTDFGHTCDTLGGSSGSPVFLRSSGTVVGLHHLGFRDGSTELVNQGVHIDAILGDIKKRYPVLDAELVAANASAAPTRHP